MSEIFNEDNRLPLVKDSGDESLEIFTLFDGIELRAESRPMSPDKLSDDANNMLNNVYSGGINHLLSSVAKK